MIQTINDTKQFIEGYTSPIFIYGVGNAGKWVAQYMKKCDIEYFGFIDKAAGIKEDAEYEGKIIVHPVNLKKIPYKEMRIIITIQQTYEAIGDLHYFTSTKEMLCLIPIYKDINAGDIRYNINRLLGYFRNKLLKVPIPSIIADSCNSGHIYQALGVTTMPSPTVNTGIVPEDFLKICKQPQVYFGEDITFSHWSVYDRHRVPVGRIKDVYVTFVHSNDADKSIKRWNWLRQYIDYENLIFIMSDDIAAPSYSILEEFCSLPEKHLLIQYKMGYLHFKSMIRARDNHFHNRGNVFENWFDILGWINGEFEL